MPCLQLPMVSADTGGLVTQKLPYISYLTIYILTYRIPQWAHLELL